MGREKGRKPPPPPPQPEMEQQLREAPPIPVDRRSLHGGSLRRRLIPGRRRGLGGGARPPLQPRSTIMRRSRWRNGGGRRRRHERRERPTGGLTRMCCSRISMTFGAESFLRKYLESPRPSNKFWGKSDCLTSARGNSCRFFELRVPRFFSIVFEKFSVFYGSVEMCYTSTP